MAEYSLGTMSYCCEETDPMDDEFTDMLHRATSGDRESMRNLLQHFGPLVRDRIYKKISPTWQSSFDADDVMQVTYLEAFLNQDRIAAEHGTSFVAWLTRIAENNLRDAVRELSRKKRPSPAHRMHANATNEDSYVALLEMLSDTGETPSRQVARAEAAEVLQGMIQRLPADYAHVLNLYDLEGKPISTVAQIMGRSTGAIHMLRSRAHDFLRGMIGRETDFFSRTA